MNKTIEITPNAKNIGPYPYVRFITGKITIVAEHMNQFVTEEYCGWLPGAISGTYTQTAGTKVPPWIVM